MKCTLVCALVVCLALTACGGQATPDPAEVAQAVAATLTAQVPTVAATPTDTATPSPIPTDTATPSPTPTVTAVASTPTPTAVPFPAGWKEFEDFGGRFSLAYPPGWTISDSSPSMVTFTLESPAANRATAVFAVAYDRIPLLSVGIANEYVFAHMIAEVERSGLSQGVLVLTEKRIWKDIGYQINYQVTDDARQGFGYMTLAPVYPGVMKVATGVKLHSDLTAEEESDIDLVLASMRVPRPLSLPTSQPTEASGDPLDEDGTVSLLDWTWYETSDDWISIDGEIENVSPNTIRYVKVHVKLLDSSANLLGVDSGYSEPKDLRPGSKALFSIMARRQPGPSRVEISQITWQQ